MVNISKKTLKNIEKRMKERDYLIVDRFYQKEILDTVKDGIKLTPSCWELIKKAYDFLDLPDLTPKEKFELVYYAVMTNDPADVRFVEANDLCDRCGWCCKYCYPIELTQRDIKRAGGLLRVDPLNSERKEVEFSIRTPCELLNEDNTCSIYQDRPSSCRSFPLSVFNGNIIVERESNCDYVLSLIVNKVVGWITRIEEKENAN